MDTYDQLKLGEKGAWISIITYLILAIIKLYIGIIGHSEGLTADGLNNTTDIIASVAVLIGLKIAQKPPDEDHSYGHYRAESIASLIAAFIMLTIGLQVIGDGIKNFFTDITYHPDWLTAWTALFCAVIMYFVYRYNYKLSKKINSSSIKAVAYDNRSDALVSIGAFIGILGTKLGIAYLDNIAAIVVGLIICKTSWHIFRDTSHALTDGFDTMLLTKIEEAIIRTPGVLEVLAVKARTQGNQILVDATICVDPYLNVIESHQITENIEEMLCQQFSVTKSLIHIEPYKKINH